MVSRILLKNRAGSTIADIRSGLVSVNGTYRQDGSPIIGVSADSGTVTISRQYRKGDPGYSINDYFNSLGSSPFPYVVRMSGVPANRRGMIFLLGGKTSQVDVNSSGLTVCDMAQTTPVTILCNAVFDMLRQLRLWIDAQKDGLLLTESSAQAMWNRMLLDESSSDSVSTTQELYGDCSSSDISVDPVCAMPRFRESRPRTSTVAKALALYNEYKALVFLWNYKAKETTTYLNIVLHPGDSAGVFISYAAGISVPSASGTSATITANVKMVGQTSRMWYRMTNHESSPPGLISSISPSSVVGNPGVAYTNSSAMQSSGYTVTDSITTPSSGVVPFYNYSFSLEVIPYMVCDESSSASTAEDEYYDSRTNGTVSNGENTWTVTISITVGGRTVTRTATKTTPYAYVCA